VLVVSPLVALMHDQHRQLEEVTRKAVQSEVIVAGSGSAARVLAQISSQPVGGGGGGGTTHCPRVLFVSPEKLQTDDFAKAFVEMGLADRVALVAIDEVHCVAEVRGVVFVFLLLGIFLLPSCTRSGPTTSGPPFCDFANCYKANSE
jgi:superfamily II DNA helicase RecQ